MIGRKLAARLFQDGSLAGLPLTKLTLFDVVAPESPATTSFAVESVEGDLRDPDLAARLIADRPDVIFHLAAVVSGEAEQDFDKGYTINLDGTRQLLESLRQADVRSKFVFASSIAVFGAPFPESIPDEFFNTPLTSYGTQKAICELLVSDYSRRELLDGIALRLPTICVRPGKPNKAASGFFSNIIREPLAGQAAVLPVTDDVLHWHASPRAAVGFMLHAAELDGERVGPRRAITMPGVAATVADQINALREIAGEQVVARIQPALDPFIQKMVAGWPRKFDARRALELGFRADADFAEIIRIHIEDELDGQIPTN